MTFHADPVGLPGLAALALGFLGFVVALLAARRRREPGGGEAQAIRSPVATLGVVVQGFGIGIAGFGPQHVTLDPLSPRALGEALLVAFLMAAAVTLFVAAAQAMGRNWSIRARMRSDHQLVQDGPFARLRHPIYTALFLVMFAIAVAFGHVPQLLAAVPAFALGTWIRIRSEEALLRGQFGADYDAYAARVKRFVPGLF